MRVLVETMKQQSITRLVSLTGTGVRFPGDKITLIDRILNLSISIIDQRELKTSKDHVRFATNCLDWTIIRVLKLQNVKRNHSH